ncbi:MAG: aspartate kinase [Flavobacteriaceae bacterium]|nr:aspartate kinase [Flavobacteriaceae bacterium]
MKIFKFGGTSVKDAEGVKNLAKVLQHEGLENTLVVVSAMGKMTNAFEKIVDDYFDKKDSTSDAILTVRNYHLVIINDLDFKQKNAILFDFEHVFAQLSTFLTQNTSKDYNFIYDQVVSFGELLSTKIVGAYLTEIGIENTWIDVREYIRTDNFYRDAKVDWTETEKRISSNIDTSKLTITQGFLSGNKTNTTTLGREGSDFTAAIFAYCLNTESVTIWKDVIGVLNADPRFFKNTEFLKQISYKEAIEMAFYGASVIHPKTLKPLENKLIPLYIRSFYELDNKGTVVKKGIDLYPKMPCFILKKNQILVSISALDFSFMVEHNLRDIFNSLHDCKLKVNLIQNSALSFTVCIEDLYDNFDTFYNSIKSKYKVTYNQDVTLFTIRHFDKDSIERIEKNNKILLKQTSRETIQVVIQ